MSKGRLRKDCPKEGTFEWRAHIGAGMGQKWDGVEGRETGRSKSMAGGVTSPPAPVKTAHLSVPALQFGSTGPETCVVWPTHCSHFLWKSCHDLILGKVTYNFGVPVSLAKSQALATPAFMSSRRPPGGASGSFQTQNIDSAGPCSLETPIPVSTCISDP